MRLLLLASVLCLAACGPMSRSAYAEKHLPGIAYDRILAIKQLFWPSGYGCTYVILRLPEDTPDTPPNASEWTPTPIPALQLPHEDNWPDGREACLTNEYTFVAQQGLQGYADEVRDILASEGAFAVLAGWHGPHAGATLAC